MEKQTINLETGTVTIEPFTEKELAIRAAQLQEIEQRQALEADKKAEREALLARLGLTEDQAKLLLS